MSVGDVNGLTVLLTRAREDAEAWAVDLAERGARAEVPWAVPRRGERHEPDHPNSQEE